MTTDAPTPDWAALGAELRAIRAAKRMSRADVEAAGGPSAATTQRVEEGRIRREIKDETRERLERVYDLSPGWILEYLAGRVRAGDDQTPLVIESNGERLLVAITEGAHMLSIAERRAVLALIRALQEGSPE